MKRHIYLKKKTLEEAEVISSEVAKLIRLETETIPVIRSLGRVIAEPLFAKVSSPPFHCAAMDGIAVKAETTYGATEESAKTLDHRQGSRVCQHREPCSKRHECGDHD